MKSPPGIRTKATSDEKGPTAPTGLKGAAYDAWWDARWKEVQPGHWWDTAGPHKALIKYLDSGNLNVEGAQLLVPGVGRGYDAVLLAERGAVVTGLEITSVAVDQAEKYLKEYNRDNGADISVSYVVESFFDHEGTYDIGYDHTFFCAIDPDLREQWAEKWNRLMKSKGTLIVMVSVVGETDIGPPWNMTPEIVGGWLEGGFELISQEKVPDDLSIPRRVDREVLQIWKRK